MTSHLFQIFQRFQISRRHTCTLSAAIFVGLLVCAGADRAEAKSSSSRMSSAHSSRAAYVGVNVNSPSHFYRPHYVGGYRGHYYRGGYWNSYYRPHFYVGLFVPFLPIGYSTFWYGARPYYYYDEVYYVRDSEGYRVVDRPATETVISAGPEPVVAAPPVLNGPEPTYVNKAKTGQLFAYPRNNQSATTATFDRIECERWGTQQTGFQPAQTPDNAEAKGNYQRAVAACLEGRGYSVK